MKQKLLYMPIFRGIQEEIKVLKSFNFEGQIYPCLEIVKETARKAPILRTHRLSGKYPKNIPFDECYNELIENIKAEKVFVDIPIYFKLQQNKTKNETLTFLLNCLNSSSKRTEYLLKLKSQSHKVIPVISSYYTINNESDSITKQYNNLYNSFENIAIRSLSDNFLSELPQIKKIVTAKDYLILDLGEDPLDLDFYSDIIEEFKNLNCVKIIHRNPFPKTFSNASILNNEIIDSIDNSLIDGFKSFGANCFSDYSGIKKNEVQDGGAISPAFAYFDACKNNFVGFRYLHGGHKKGESKPELSEFEDYIVPNIIMSDATFNMNNCGISYLNTNNIGWNTINQIHKGLESGKSQSKFKNIGLQHYLYCIREKIRFGLIK